MHKVLLFSLTLLSLFVCKGQLGVNTVNPDKSAILDVSSSNKGMLIPRISLTSTTMDLDGDPGTVQPEGLMIYNVGGVMSHGFYFWNGTEWRIFEDSTAIVPSISQLLCNSASLSPSSYIKGEPYVGIMKIPYTGGNGGRYLSGNSITSNGLTFKLQEGKLDIGSGELLFNVTGVPEVSSPVATDLSLNNTITPFTQQTCAIRVGDQIGADIKTIATMGMLTSTDEGRKGYALKITTPDGKFSIRAFVPSTGYTINAVNLQIRNNSTSNVSIISNEHWLWGGSGGNQHNSLELPAGKWAGYYGDSAAHVVATVQSGTNFPSWGDPEVYAGGMPEQRLYSFTTDDSKNKVFYNIKFMMGAENPGGSVATICSTGECLGTKAFFLIEQIQAY